MGKKVKKTKVTPNGTDSTLAPTTVETVPKENVGLSEKSKKIKKKKKDKPSAAVTVEQVTEAVASGNAVPKSKKKKNKDKQVPVAAADLPVVKSKVVQNGDGAKHKKKNNKRAKDGEQPKKSDKKVKKLSKQKENKAPANKPKAIAADNDVVTSESESDVEEEADESTAMDKVNQSVLSQHSSVDKDSSDDENDEGDSKEGKHSDSAKESTKKSTRIQSPEYSVFVGNLPTSIKQGAIKKLFMPYGRILTMRFRTSDGVTLFKKKDRKEAKALICYVRFSFKEEAIAACAMNGQMVEDNRIRVSLHTQKHLGHIASTVFVGNISRKTTDNELYDYFSRVGEIEYVRQISDKGIGYVCFKKGVSIAKALKLNQQLLNGRPLRIAKVDPNRQHKRKNKKGNLVDKRPPLAGAMRRVAQKTAKSAQEKSQPTDFHGTVAKKQAGGRNQKHHKKGGGAEYKKKILAQKLAAAAGKPKKFR